MALTHILLGLLRQPTSGYRLKTAFNESVRHFWSAELSQIYPTLKRMEESGWLECWTEPSERGPEQKVYSITEEGRVELRRWLATGPQVGNERYEYLAQLFFMDELGNQGSTRDFLVTLRARLGAWLAELQAIEAQIATCPGFPDALPDEVFHPHLTLRMGLHTIAAKIAWCDESIARLEARSATAATRE